MSKKPQDLSWQEEYAREYRRTSGLGLSFGPVEPGGWYTVTFESSVPPSPHTRRMRRGQVVGNTARLREREDHVPEPANG